MPSNGQSNPDSNWRLVFRHIGRFLADFPTIFAVGASHFSFLRIPKKCPQFPVAGAIRRRTSLDEKIVCFNGLPRIVGCQWTLLDLNSFAFVKFAAPNNVRYNTVQLTDWSLE